MATDSKVSDARRKSLRMIYARLGQNDLARQEFTQVKKLYPNSTSAHLADIELHSNTLFISRGLALGDFYYFRYRH